MVIGTVPSGSSAALKDAINLKYSNWSIGLVLSVPLYSVISRAEVAQAKLDLEQANIRLKNQEQQIELEIKTSLRDVETNYKSVQAYKLARDLALKKLEAEEKKLKVGLTTNYFVLLYQRDLADAHSAEIRALIDYNLSLSRLDRALGTSLQNRNIKFSSVLEKTF